MTDTPRNPGPDIDGAQADHFLGLPGAHIVATDALMLTRDNIADVIEAKAISNSVAQQVMSKQIVQCYRDCRPPRPELIRCAREWFSAPLIPPRIHPAAVPRARP